ncbi:MAG: GTPase HflX, partial [Firmicutes bacterium]|nr:GTPase HflX [Bacillota bacterium]
PHDLIAAFRATLEEIKEADLLLHVIDASDDQVYAKIEEGVKTLSEIGADEIPVIRVMNKIDLVSENERRRFARDEDAVLVSTVTTENIDSLLRRIARSFDERRVRASFLIPYDSGNVENAIRTRGRVESVEYRENGVCIVARVGRDVLNRYSDYIAAREG